MVEQLPTSEIPKTPLERLAEFTGKNGFPFTSRLTELWGLIKSTPDSDDPQLDPANDHIVEFDKEGGRIVYESEGKIKAGLLQMDELIPGLSEALAKLTLYRHTGREAQYIDSLKDFLYQIEQYRVNLPDRKISIMDLMYDAMDEGILDESLVDELRPTINDLYSDGA